MCYIALYLTVGKFFFHITKYRSLPLEWQQKFKAGSPVHADHLWAWMGARTLGTWLFLLELQTCCICANLRKYQCYICSSHSYNHNLTSGPSGPHQIVNFYHGNFPLYGSAQYSSMFTSLHLLLCEDSAPTLLHLHVVSVCVSFINVTRGHINSGACTRIMKSCYLEDSYNSH